MRPLPLAWPQRFLTLRNRLKPLSGLRSSRPFLSSNAKTLSRSTQTHGILYSYSFDATSSLVSHKSSLPASGRRIVRAGRQSTDMQTQRLTLRTAHPVKTSGVCHLFGEPAVFWLANLNCFVFSASTALFPLTRSLGHTGPTRRLRKISLPGPRSVLCT